MENSSNKYKWLNAGYGLFGHIGPFSLNIERLSNIIKLSRSSFYHYFNNLENYETDLLTYHVTRFKEFGSELSSCKKLEPDAIHVIFHRKEETLFQRSLLVNESNNRYRNCFDQARTYTEEPLYHLWRDHLDKKSQKQADQTLYEVIRDYLLVHFEQLDAVQLEQEIHRIELTMIRH